MYFNLKFEKIEICEETGNILNYPSQENQQFVVLTKDNKFIHCISILSLEDTCTGSEEMLICVPLDEEYNYDICFYDCKYVAYLGELV